MWGKIKRNTKTVFVNCIFFWHLEFYNKGKLCALATISFLPVCIKLFKSQFDCFSSQYTSVLLGDTWSQANKCRWEWSRGRGKSHVSFVVRIQCCSCYKGLAIRSQRRSHGYWTPLEHRNVGDTVTSTLTLRTTGPRL